MATDSARIGALPALSEAAIVAAARELARKHGFAKISMRSLGAELGVSAPALYHHFKDKKALFERVAADILEEIATVDATSPWTEQLRSFVFTYQSCLLDYPGLARIMLVNRESRASMLWTETIFSILQRGGFKDDAMWSALGTLVFLVNPMTLFDETPRAVHAALYNVKLVKQTIDQSPSTYPILNRLLSCPPGNSTALQLSYGVLLPMALERIIAQLEADKLE